MVRKASFEFLHLCVDILLRFVEAHEVASVNGSRTLEIVTYSERIIRFYGFDPNIHFAPCDIELRFRCRVRARLVDVIFNGHGIPRVVNPPVTDVPLENMRHASQFTVGQVGSLHGLHMIQEEPHGLLTSHHFEPHICKSELETGSRVYMSKGVVNEPNGFVAYLNYYMID